MVLKRCFPKYVWVDAEDMENFQIQEENDNVDTPAWRKISMPSTTGLSEILQELKCVKEQVIKIFQIFYKQRVSIELLNATEARFSCTTGKRSPLKAPLI